MPQSKSTFLCVLLDLDETGLNSIAKPFLSCIMCRDELNSNNGSLEGGLTRAEMLPGVGRDITAFMNTVQALEKGTRGNFPFIKVLASGNSMSLHKVAHMRKRKIDETFRD